MTPEFLELINKNKAVLAYHGGKGETVILDKKQPHHNSERLFERFSPAERIMLESALDSSSDCGFCIGDHLCEIATVSDSRVAILAPADGEASEQSDVYDRISLLADIEFKSKRDPGFCFADKLFSKIVPDLCRIYPDMEFSYMGGGWGNELFEISLSNLIRVCMLCAEISNIISSDRCMGIKLYSTSEELKLRFSTGCTSEMNTPLLLDLARFVCEKEGGRFEAVRDGRLAVISLVFRSEPDEIPEFKFRDQFEGYGEYLSKIEREMASLRAEQESKHKN